MIFCSLILPAVSVETRKVFLVKLIKSLILEIKANQKKLPPVKVILITQKRRLMMMNLLSLK